MLGFLVFMGSIDVALGCAFTIFCVKILSLVLRDGSIRQFAQNFPGNSG